MVYAGGELERWRRAFTLDKLYNRGLVDVEQVWCPVTRDWDVVYVRTWRDPIEVGVEGSTRVWDYNKATPQQTLTFALEKIETYKGVADIATVAANARNYRLLGEEENGKLNVQIG